MDEIYFFFNDKNIEENIYPSMQRREAENNYSDEEEQNLEVNYEKSNGYY